MIQYWILVWNSKFSIPVRQEAYGTNADAAARRYFELERKGHQTNETCVLVGADSLQTIKRTHSSWF